MVNYNKLSRMAISRGTFGPPTKAHMNNGEQVVEQIDAKLAYFAAVPKPEHKKGVIDVEHRHNMLLRASEKFSKIDALRIGVKQSLKKTIANLQLANPNTETVSLLGDDVFEYMLKGNGAAMQSFASTGASIAVMPRHKTKEELKQLAEQVEFMYGLRVYVLESSTQMTGMSSLQVIQNIQDKNFLKQTLPEGVPEYIWEYNLWNANGLPPEIDENGFEIQPSGIYTSTKRKSLIVPSMVLPTQEVLERKKKDGGTEV